MASEFSASNSGQNIINITSHNATLNSNLIFKGSSVSSGSGNIIDIGSGKTLTLGSSAGSGNVDTQSGKTHINFASGAGTLAGGVRTASGDALTTITLQAGASGTINGAVAGGGSNDILYKANTSGTNSLTLGSGGNTIRNLTVEDTGNAILAGNDATIGTINLDGSHTANLTLKNTRSTITSLTNTGTGVFSLDGTNNAVVATVANAVNSSTLTLNFDGKGADKGAQLTLSGGGNTLKTLTVGAGSTNNKLILASGKTTFNNFVDISNAGSDITFDLANGVEVAFSRNMRTVGATSTFVVDATSATKSATISGGDVRASELRLTGGSNSSSATLKNMVSVFTTLTTTGTATNTLTLDTSSNGVKTTVTNAISGANLNVALGGTATNSATFILGNSGGNTTLKSLTLKNNSSATQNVFQLNSGNTTITDGINIEASKGLNTKFYGDGTTLVNDVTNSGDFDLDFGAVHAILKGSIDTQSSGNTAINVANGEGTITGNVSTVSGATTSISFVTSTTNTSAKTLKLQGGTNTITSVSATSATDTLKLDTANNAVTTTISKAITGGNLNVQLGGKSDRIATLTLKNTDGESELKTLTLTEASSDVTSNILNLESNKTKIGGGVSVTSGKGLTINLKEDNVNLESNLVSSGGLLVNFEKGTNTITGNITANGGTTTLKVADNTNGVVTGRVNGANNAYVEFATKATAQNSLTLSSAGNTLKELKVLDSGDAVLDGLDVDISDVKIGGSNNAKLTLKNTNSDITTLSVGANGDSTFALETENQNSVLANVTNAINGGNLAVVLGGQNDKVATLTLNNASGDTTLKSLSLSASSDINDNILNLNARTTSFSSGVNVESGKGLKVNFAGAGTTLASNVATAGVSEVNFNGSNDKLDGNVSTSGTSTLNFNGALSTITGTVSSSGSDAQTTINVSGATNGVISGVVTYANSGANVLNFLTGTTNSLTLNAEGNQLTELNVGNNGSSTLAGKDVTVATMKLGDSASANLTLKNTKTDITALNANGSTSTLALNSASNGVEASVTNAVAGDKLTVHFSGTKTDDNPSNTTLFTLKAGGNALKAITVASDSKGNTLSLESGATSINDQVNIAGNSAIDFNLGNTASAQLTLSGSMQNAGVANVNFNKSNGSFSGGVSTSGTTTFAFAEDSGTYGINGNLSTSGAGKNIIDLSSKSATISNDLAFAGSSVTNGAGNIVNIGASKTLSLKSGSDVKSMNTASGNTYVNLDGESATFSGNAETSGGAVAFNFNGTSGTLDGDISTSGGSTTLNIANAGSGITKGSIDTSSSGVTNVVYGASATSLALQGASNKITNVTSAGAGNILALDTTTQGVSAEITNAVSGETLAVKLGGNSTNGAELTLNNASGNTTLASLTLTGSTSGADKNILNLKANTTTIAQGIDVSANKGLTINLDGTTTALQNTLTNQGSAILNFNASAGVFTGDVVASGGTTQINFKGSSGTISGGVSTTGGTTTINIEDTKNGVISGSVSNSGTTNVVFANTTGATANTLSLNGADNTITSLTVKDGGKSVLLGNKVTMTDMKVGEANSAELTLKNTESAITTLTSVGSGSILSLGKTDNSVVASITNSADSTDNLTLNFGAQGSNKAELTLNGSDNDFKVITLENDSIGNKLILNNNGTTTFTDKIEVGGTSGITFDLGVASASFARVGGVSSGATLELNGTLENAGNTTFNFNNANGVISGNIKTTGNTTLFALLDDASGIVKGDIDTTGGETNITYDTSATSLALQGASNKITNVTSAGVGNILALDTTTQGVSAEITNAISGETLAVQLGGNSTNGAELTLNNASGDTTLASLTLTGDSTDVAQNVLNLKANATTITAGIALEANKALSINISGKDAQSTTLDNNLSNTAGKLKLDFKSGNGILDGAIATTSGTTDINVSSASNAIITGTVDGEGTTNIAFAAQPISRTRSVESTPNSLSLNGEGNKVSQISVADSASAFLKGKDVEVATLQLGTSGNANLTLQNTDSTISALTLGSGATAITLDGANNAVNASVANAVNGGNLTLTLNGRASGARSGAQGATFTLKEGDNTIQTLSLGTGSSGNKLVLEQGKTTITNEINVNNADLSVDFSNGVEFALGNGFTTTSGTSTFNVNTSGAENSASVSGGTVSITNLNLTGTEGNSATMAFKNANTTITNVISSGSAILDLSQATGTNTRSGSTATTTTITNGIAGDNLTVKLGGTNTGVATLTLNNANGNSTIKTLTLGGSENTLNLTAKATKINDGISVADKTFNINLGNATLDNGITTTGTGTTNISIADNAHALISGDILTGTSGKTRDVAPSTASTNVTLGANSALALQGHNNQLSKVTMSNKGVEKEANYLLLTKEKNGDGPARKATIDELVMSNDTTALILGVQLAETEADTFVFEKTSGTQQTDGTTTVFNASPDAGNGETVDSGVVDGSAGGSTNEKPDVEQIQSKHKITITLRSGTTLESVGKDRAVLVASVKNDTNSANLKFASKSVAYGDFSQGDATFVTEQKDGYTNYLVGTIKNIQTIVAEQEITATAFTLNYDLYVANFNSLNKRMGDLRANPHSQGVWARVFNGAQTNNFGIGSKSNYTTIQGGYDYAFGGEGFNNYLGFALSYALSTSTARNEFVDKNKQRAINDIYSQAAEVAVYNSFVSDIGWYNDTIGKFSYIMSDFTINHVGENISTDNATKNYAFTLSNEFGYRFALGESKEWSITPQLEMGFGYFNQSDFKQTLENSGAYIVSSADAVLTLRTRAGSSFGYDFKRFTQGKGIEASLYVGAFYEFDYIQGGEIRFQTSDAPDVVTNRHSDLSSDGRVVMNVGTNMTIKDNTRLYFDFEKSFVGKITTDYQVNLGVRYSFGESNGYTPINLGIEGEEDKKAPLKIEEKDEAKKVDKIEDKKDTNGEKKEQESKKEAKQDKAKDEKKVEEKKEAKSQTEATKKEDKKEISSKILDKKVAKIRKILEEGYPAPQSPHQSKIVQITQKGKQCLKYFRLSRHKF